MALIFKIVRVFLILTYRFFAAASAALSAAALASAFDIPGSALLIKRYNFLTRFPNILFNKNISYIFCFSKLFLDKSNPLRSKRTTKII